MASLIWRQPVSVKIRICHVFFVPLGGGFPCCEESELTNKELIFPSCWALHQAHLICEATLAPMMPEVPQLYSAARLLRYPPTCLSSFRHQDGAQPPSAIWSMPGVSTSECSSNAALTLRHSRRHGCWVCWAAAHCTGVSCSCGASLTTSPKYSLASTIGEALDSMPLKALPVDRGFLLVVQSSMPGSALTCYGGLVMRPGIM